LNAHRLLAGTDRQAGFWKNISLDDETERKPLIAVRDEIRKVLREGFVALNDGGFKRKAVLLKAEQAFRAKDDNFRLAPRFRMQGSFAYFTVNRPAWAPPQQIDLDDGVYLPTSFVGQHAPVVAAKAFFSVVEDILRPLCDRHEWTLCRDKSSCVRIVLGEGAHIDLPLYAIPDEDFLDPRSVVAKAMGGMTMDSALMAEDASGELSKAAYEQIPSDRIMLAKRDGAWEESDPRKMDRWFKDAVAEHGQQLRRISRYLKAWRDYQWKTQGLGMTSICLMACVVTAFDDLAGSVSEDRDDIALKEVCARLPGLLAGDIPNPVVDGACLDDGWSDQQRESYRALASELHRTVCAALDGAVPLRAVQLFRVALGSRVPEDLSLVSVVGLEAEIVRRAPAVMPAPVVSRSTSG
jgi:hypothetical protein